MQGTQYATKRSILCRGAFCGPTTPTLLKRTMPKCTYYYYASQRHFVMRYKISRKLVHNPIVFMVSFFFVADRRSDTTT